MPKPDSVVERIRQAIQVLKYDSSSHSQMEALIDLGFCVKFQLNDLPTTLATEDVLKEAVGPMVKLLLLQGFDNFKKQAAFVLHHLPLTVYQTALCRHMTQEGAQAALEALVNDPREDKVLQEGQNEAREALKWLHGPRLPEEEIQSCVQHLKDWEMADGRAGLGEAQAVVILDALASEGKEMAIEASGAIPSLVALLEHEYLVSLKF